MSENPVPSEINRRTGEKTSPISERAINLYDLAVDICEGSTPGPKPDYSQAQTVARLSRCTSICRHEAPAIRQRNLVAVKRR